MEISTFKIIESAAKRRRETEACMNVTEKMHRIQVAANAWYAAMRHQFDEAFHRLWERVRR